MPAGFPAGMPGIGEEIDRAMQQAPQPGLQRAGPALIGRPSVAYFPEVIATASRATLVISSNLPPEIRSALAIQVPPTA